jgi:hypothetical protein
MAEPVLDQPRVLPYIEAVLSGQRVEYEANVHYKGVGSCLVRVIYTPDHWMNRHGPLLPLDSD